MKRRKGTSKKSKSKHLRDHSRRRAQERFDFELTAHRHGAIVQQIQEGEAKFITKYSNSRTLFSVAGNVVGIDKAKDVPVIYDKQRKTIITVLPETVLSKKGNENQNE